MEINQIFDFLSVIPTWTWIVAGIAFVVIFFGDRKLWELEVKFPIKQGIGRGEVEFECLKKKGSSIEAKFQLEELYQNKSIEIYLNNRLVFTISENENKGARTYINKKIEIQKPSEGDEVIVNIGGQKQFSGVLVRD